ncbi:hypothetical protein [Deminuibacter soli]|nr:hypothetical protein [Deminuibacter soli]
MRYSLLCSLCCISLFYACGQRAAYFPANTPFKSPAKVGELADKRLDEASGVAPSHIKNDYYWLHNDSGDKARVFLMKRDGSAQGVANFNELVLDCEDIASGIGYLPGTFVYLGDIGDNHAIRANITVYTFDENELFTAAQKEGKIKRYNKTVLTYPDGPRDAETLMIDPVDSLLYIVSKREKNVHIYSAPLKAIFKQSQITLQLHAQIPYTYITSGDIAANGSEVVIKNYDSVYYWKRAAHEPVYKTMQRPALRLPYRKEKQGEGICFTTSNDGFITVSEGKHTPVYFYQRK